MLRHALHRQAKPLSKVFANYVVAAPRVHDDAKATRRNGRHGAPIRSGAVGRGALGPTADTPVCMMGVFRRPRLGVGRAGLLRKMLDMGIYPPTLLAPLLEPT